MNKKCIPHGWKNVHLKDVCEKIADRNHITPTYVKEGCPLISPTNFINHLDIDFENCKRISLEDLEIERKKCDPKKGDLLFSRIGTVGLVRKVNTDKLFVPLHSIAQIRVDNTKASTEFIYQWLGSPLMKKQIRDSVQSIGVPDIGIAKIQNFRMDLPESLDEQDKIAFILSTVDETIESTDKIIETYSRLKKSMLNKLLTKGFDTKKFKKVEYRTHKYMEIPEHWEWTTLGKYTRPESGSTPSKRIPEYYTGSIPWVTTVDLNYGWITKPTEYITNEAVKSAHLTIHPKGTFLIAITGLEAAGTRGRCGILDIDATTSQSCIAFETGEQVLPEFLFYWYQCFSHSIIFQLAQGTKQQSLNINIVRDILIALPPIVEQKKIIEIMKQLDKTLQINKEKKVGSIKMKKSLMQKLLSGEMRVKVN